MGPDPASDTVPSAKQVVFLFMAATVVAVVVFLCGVLVGRGVPLGEGLTVSGSAVEGLGVDDLPPPTLSTPSAEPSAAADESADLTYYRRLSDEGEPELETLRPEAGDAAEVLPPPPVDSPAGVDSGGADLNRSPPPTDLDAPPLVDATQSSTPAASTPSTGGFSVQVSALRSLESARQVVSQLVAKGYPATVVSPETGNPVQLFRVRVGPYTDLTEAERISGRLETEEQYDPFVTR